MRKYKVDYIFGHSAQRINCVYIAYAMFVIRLLIVFQFLLLTWSFIESTLFFDQTDRNDFGYNTRTSTCENAPKT